MGRSCREVDEWIVENVSRPIEEWEERQERRCREEPCNWWMLCLNKLFCWLAVILVKVVRWVVVEVGRWVTRTVCTVVNLVLDLLGAIWHLILTLPILGGILRTIGNWVTEIIWRIINIPEFLGSLVGVRLRKKMYFGFIIPIIDGVPLATAAQMQPHVDAAQEAFDRLCNIDLRFTGFCFTNVRPPAGGIVFDCGLGGFFSDWGLDGSWFEFVSLSCKFESNWRRAVGAGGELMVFVVNNVTPDSATSTTIGCSMSGTHNYVVVEAGSGPLTTAHELGHACLLPHDGGPSNLMFPNLISGLPDLTALQIATVRSSRHATYI